MSDWWELLREKNAGGRNLLNNIQLKALASPHVYEVWCCYNDLVLAKFIVWGIEKKKLGKILNENFLLFNLNSEGSGEFYFKNKLIPLLDKNECWSEPLEILDFRDFPITNFKFIKLKPMSKRKE